MYWMSVWEAQNWNWLACQKDLESVLKSIDALITSQKTKWSGGEHRLGAKHVQAIQSYLQMVLKGANEIQASEIAAHSYNFSKVNGRWEIWQWVNVWIKDENLPTSVWMPCQSAKSSRQSQDCHRDSTLSLLEQVSHKSHEILGILEQDNAPCRSWWICKTNC